MQSPSCCFVQLAISRATEQMIFTSKAPSLLLPKFLHLSTDLAQSLRTNLWWYTQGNRVAPVNYSRLDSRRLPLPRAQRLKVRFWRISKWTHGILFSIEPFVLPLGRFNFKCPVSHFLQIRLSEKRKPCGSDVSLLPFVFQHVNQFEKDKHSLFLVDNNQIISRKPTVTVATSDSAGRVSRCSIKPRAEICNRTNGDRNGIEDHRARGKWFF